MTEKAIFIKMLNLLLFCCVGILNGCVSQNEQTVLLAKERAQQINLNLPVKIDGYTMISAQNSGSFIKLIIVNNTSERGKMNPQAFLDKFQKNICTDEGLKEFMNDGINYILIVKDMRTGFHHEKKLNPIECNYIKK